MAFTTCSILRKINPVQTLYALKCILLLSFHQYLSDLIHSDFALRIVHAFFIIQHEQYHQMTEAEETV
jgi:hypothetical protein